MPYISPFVSLWPPCCLIFAPAVRLLARVRTGDGRRVYRNELAGCEWDPGGHWAGLNPDSLWQGSFPRNQKMLAERLQRRR
jgi:hypothetical protein